MLESPAQTKHCAMGGGGYSNLSVGARLRRSSTSIPGRRTSASRRLGVTTFASRGLSGCYKRRLATRCRTRLGLLSMIPHRSTTASTSRRP